ncbi:MAG TPA: 23S rRNA (pseudouridine(1915)-N(3))-methyltransferase RlmH [Firmicutes bacterium]|jgi:23S rRNA (pseudouridine1915-N3)-methyltransferase|nr:23S rRNA (pseudouridine(1915)-N(3))-methyltransferase RlmH [Bacillota bacterium]
MARIRIITVGKLKESYLQEAQAEYIKRLKPYVNLELVEVNDLPAPDGASPAQEEQVKGKEGALIQNLLHPKEYVVTLDRQGKELSSLQFATFLEERAISGDPLTLVIGGSLGLSDELIKSAQMNWSFSKLTFPHQLFRVMLLEQIYRACKINRHEPYHK